MQAHHRSPPNGRINSYHGGKRQLLGSPAANVAPAWKANAQTKEKQKSHEESKILLSRLPMDVGDAEVEVSARPECCRHRLGHGAPMYSTSLQELFKKTVGPVKVRGIE
jgi:hypothetical protein